jgi:Ca-activated chloride channel family protein
MNRTVAIFITAAILALVALVLAKNGETTAPLPPPPVPGTVASGGMTLSTSPSQSHVLVGAGEVFLDIALAAPAAKHVKRVPLNIGLVIDRSGSMAGRKLQNAREAATRLVSRLQEGDRIAIVTYGSDVTVLVPSTEITAESRTRILSAISTIVDRGGTFLSGGLERARDEVLRHDRRGMVNRVILISDGQANEGITSPGELSTLARKTLSMGVNVTTMGVGLDFNEEVMTAMAEHGGGHYYFIENASAMARFFTDELDTMTAVVAQTATLELELEPQVDLLEIYGYTYERLGNRVVIKLPDLFSGQKRKVMCKVRVPASREGKVAVGKMSLTFTDADSGKRHTLTSEAQVMITADEKLVEAGRDEEVLAKAEQVQAAQAMHSAMKAYAAGDVDRSRALLRKQIRRARTVNRRLKNKALGNAADEMEQQLEGTAAAPSSSAGRSLVKKGKYGAYKLFK